MTIRSAVHDLHALADFGPPEWVDDDRLPMSPAPSGGLTVHAHLTIDKKGTHRDDPNRVRIAYVYAGKEHIAEEWPPGTPHRPLMEDLVTDLNIPVSEIRAYVGDSLIESFDPKMRGG